MVYIALENVGSVSFTCEGNSVLEFSVAVESEILLYRDEKRCLVETKV